LEQAVFQSDHQLQVSQLIGKNESRQSKHAMEITSNKKEAINRIIQRQSDFFKSGQTLAIEYRLMQLKKLYKAIRGSENAIFDALHADFNKPAFESFATEVALVQAEIKYFLRNLPNLMRPQRVKSSLASLPASSHIYREPFGRSLIIGPWNYPVQLIFIPLVGAIAAGNCVLLKPSELTEKTTALIAKLIHDCFDEAYVAVVEGGPEVSTELLSKQFDHIFFTGSVRVGKIVYQAAAKHLTPCVLELGGKSPCIVDADANLDLAARRIVWGKFVNGGQTCVAPDYLLAHKSIKAALMSKIVDQIKHHYGENPKTSPDFPRIINQRNFERLKKLLKNSRVAAGGETDASERYIAPTVLDEVDWQDEVMQDEIFGPILPVMEFEKLDDALKHISERPKPLALYYFSSKKTNKEKVLQQVSFGGGCINDTLLHFGSHSIPVGGVGNSGLGAYHGKESFLAFSHSKGIVKKRTSIDIPLRYPPYRGKMKWLKMIFR
jgi:aldehyde dehydrogenase (NAD+)